MKIKWLIRDSQYNITGPFSTNVVKEKYKRGELKKEDELSQGCGFWFWIKEQNLVQYFLINENVQNPEKPFISEGLTTRKVEKEENNIQRFQRKKITSESIDLNTNNKKNIKNKKTTNNLHKARDDRFLYIIILLITLTICFIFYYYKYVINSSIDFDDITAIKNINNVMAKDVVSPKKKRQF